MIHYSHTMVQQFIVPKSQSTLTHTHKDKHMHDSTHNFALIFQSTLVSTHSRSKRSIKACNEVECKYVQKAQ